MCRSIKMCKALGEPLVNRGEPIGESLRITWPGVIPGQMSCRWGKIVEDRPTSGQRRRHSGHARAREWMKDDITRLCIVFNEGQYGLRRHLGMITVREIERAVPAAGDAKPPEWGLYLRGRLTSRNIARRRQI